MVRWSLSTEATYISIPKTKLLLVSCNLSSLSVGNCQNAAHLLAHSPQTAKRYPSRKLHVHQLTVLLAGFSSSRFLTCFSCALVMLVGG